MHDLLSIALRINSVVQLSVGTYLEFRYFGEYKKVKEPIIKKKAFLVGLIMLGDVLLIIMSFFM